MLHKGDRKKNHSEIEAFRALLRQRKNLLQDEAFQLGRLFLLERKKAILKRWEDYWDRSQHTGRA